MKTQTVMDPLSDAGTSFHLLLFSNRAIAAFLKFAEEDTSPFLPIDLIIARDFNFRQIWDLPL